MPNNEEIKRIVRAKGGAERASVFINALARGKQFSEALETPIGKELVEDIINQMEILTENILWDKDTEESRSLLKAYRTIYFKWSDKIKKLNNDMNSFTEMTKGV